jgi:hypothetical protein
MPTVSMLQKAIWALSLCPVDEGGTLLPPLSVLESAKLGGDGNRLAPTGHDAKRRARKDQSFAAPANLASCASDSIC